MFKHLARLNQLRTAATTSAFTLTNVMLPMRTPNNTGLIRNMVQVPQFNLFQVGRQVSAVNFSTNSSRRQVPNSIPDYEVEELLHNDLKKIVLTPEEVNKKHPTEYIKESLGRVDYRQHISETEFMLFNLPFNITKEKIIELCQVKGVNVINAALTPSLNETARHAFAYVQVGSPAQVKILKERFRNVWLDDKKIKMKAKEDLQYEVFDHRTIIVKNLPNHYHKKQLVEIFQNYGAIVGIEIPVKNQAIEQELQNKVNQHEVKRNLEKELSVRRAQKLVKDTVKENIDYYNAVFSKYFGAEETQQIITGLTEEGSESAETQVNRLLNDKRHISIQHMIQQLQAENVQVSKAKSTLTKLRNLIDSSIPSLDATVSSRDVTSQLQQNKELLSNTLTYLKNNRENLDEVTLAKLNESLNPEGTTSDPIQSLQRLSRTELAYAYDFMINLLNQREILIENRIKDQINHLGKEERVIFEEKDWHRETEDIKKFDDPFGDIDLKAEEIMSVNEQVRGIISFKNISPQQRLYEIVTKQFNPFLTPNFNVNQMAAAQGDKINTYKIPKDAIKPNQAPSIARLNFGGYRFLDDNLEHLEKHVASLRDKFDLPFDELYHKEKRLVDAVIKATQALEAKEAALPNPMGDERTFQLEELKGEYFGEEFQGEHPFIKAERKRNEKLLDQSLDDAGSSRFQFKLDETKTKIQELLDQGVLTRKEYDQLILMERQANEVNLGYAFVSFSHSDEAKLAIILATGIIMDGFEADLSLKIQGVDHKDFDQRYNVNRQRNEATIIKELQALRESRKELREFEKNIDRDLPSMKKLNEFRDLAREVIEGADKPSFGTKRTQEQEEALNDKIRQLQKQNPDIDYTQLFDTERAELARKSQHKKAFASYKAFQFLKNGIKAHTDKLESNTPLNAEKLLKKKTPAPYQTADPYDFPPLEEAVKTVMRGSSDGLPRVLDAGDQLDSRPGRKFGYTDQDFLDAYFGKDNARAARVTLDDETSIFGFNESFKRKYPIEKYQKLPEIEAKKRLLEEKQIIGVDTYNSYGDLQKETFNEFMRSLDLDRSMLIQDKPHPTDQNRSLLKDIETRMENYTKRKAKVTGRNIVNSKEVGYIRSKLKDEYFPKPKKEESAAPATDAKQEEKFEPFFEGENAQDNTAQASSESTTTSSSDTSNAPPEKQQYKKEYKKGGSGGQGKYGNRRDRDSQQPKASSNFKLEEDDFQFEHEANSDVKDLNKEFLYDYRFREDKRPRDPEVEFDSKEIKRLKQFAEANNMDPAELFKLLKDTGKLTPESATYGGLFTDKERFGLNKGEMDVKGRERRQRSIEDFAGKGPQQGEDEDLSEREDEDIYTHYIEQMRKAKLEAAQEKPADKDLKQNQKLAQETLKDLEEGIFQDMPRFEGFFKSQANKKHPFEDDQYQYKDKTTAEQDRAEDQYDEELQQRELEGRLLGEKLTPRQFQLLYNTRVEGQGNIKYLKDNDSNEFLDSRDLVRLMEEQREAARRRMVINGQWTEAESDNRMQEMVKEVRDDIPTEFDERRIHREFRGLVEVMSRIQNPQKFYEKEYHFDEGLGQSLKDHVDELKTNFPDLQVLVRRDRDGYAIVKTQYKPKYKYNLEDIENLDVDRDMTAVKETLDDYLKTVLGQKGLQSLDKAQLEQKLAMMTKNKNGQQRYDFDEKTKSSIKALWDERIKGRFQTDREGFAKAFLELSETASYDTTKPLGKITPFTSNEVNTEAIFDGLMQERELMTYELTEQLSLRIKEHLFLKERKESDFVRARRSELSLFDNQVSSHENAARSLEDRVSEIEAARQKDQAKFDREAYQEIKAEIKRRREAKERLLKQGFPELKSYVTL